MASIKVTWIFLAVACAYVAGQATRDIELPDIHSPNPKSGGLSRPEPYRGPGTGQATRPIELPGIHSPNPKAGGLSGPEPYRGPGTDEPILGRDPRDTSIKNKLKDDVKKAENSKALKETKAALPGALGTAEKLLPLIPLIPLE